MNQRSCSGTLSVALITSAALVILTAAAGSAKITPAQKCAVAKLKATSKKSDSKVKCYVKTKLAAADPTCLQKAEQNFAKAFAKAESAAACSTMGDAAAVESSVDTFVTALVQALQPQARAATTPGQKCAITKLLAASKETTAKLRCHQGVLSTGGSSKLTSCLSSAEDKFTKSFAKAEAGPCATQNDVAARTTGDAAAIGGLVDTFVTGVEQALGRFMDNGDGTITDTQTGLMWEKKDQSGGLHDVNNLYDWAGVCCPTSGSCTYPYSSYCQPNAAAEAACNAATGGAYGCSQCSSGTCNLGTARTTIWDWLVQLNASNFAGRSDWRIPTSAGELDGIITPPGQPPELDSLLNTSIYQCGGPTDQPPHPPCTFAAFDTGCTPGCTVTACSCTAGPWPYAYYSATSDVTPGDFPGGVWVVDFTYGHIPILNKAPGDGLNVRAVR